MTAQFIAELTTRAATLPPSEVRDILIGILTVIGSGRSAEGPQPCPFCGATSLMNTKNEPIANYVMCLECGSSGPLGKTERHAWDAWNRRAGNGTD